jgi:hypothetical protein
MLYRQGYTNSLYTTRIVMLNKVKHLAHVERCFTQWVPVAQNDMLHMLGELGLAGLHALNY